MSEREIKEFPFPTAELLAEKEKTSPQYHIFPEEYEGNCLVAFHGTTEACFDKIKEEGFQLKNTDLETSAFAKKSMGSLTHLMTLGARNDKGNRHVIIMVEFSENHKIYKSKEDIYISDHTPANQPKIIGVSFITDEFKDKW